MSAPTSTRTRASLLLIGLSFVGFVSLGLPDGLLGVAWPSMRRDFSLPLDALGALLVATLAGYLLASSTSGRVVGRLGVGRLLGLSCLVTAASLVGIAIAPAWAFTVALGFLTGLGAGAIDAGLNAFAAIHFSARFVNWLHASFGVGVTIGPALMGAVLDAGLAWRWGYALVGAAQVGLGLVFLATAARWVVATPSGPADVPEHAPSASSRRLTLWLGVLVFFVYTGVELTAGGWAFSLLVESRAMDAGPASLAVSTYWGTFAAGRVLFGMLGDRFRPAALVRACIVGMLIGAALVWLDAGIAPTVLGLVVVGVAAAPIYPALISATPRRVGAEGAHGAVGLQVSAAGLGGALLPGLAGVLAEWKSLELIPPFMLALGVVLLALHEALVRQAR